MRGADSVETISGGAKTLVASLARFLPEVSVLNQFLPGLVIPDLD